jgi:hypothetical protein
MRQTSLWYLLIPAVLLLGAAGMAASQLLLGDAATECAKEPIALTTPTNPALVIEALQLLIDAGIVPDRESALSSFVGAQYVFDPDEGGELEYWIIFQSVGRTTAAEFNFHCALDEEDVPLDLEYEGVRGL